MSIAHKLTAQASRTSQFAGRLCFELAALGFYVPPSDMSEAVMRAEEYMATHDEKGRLK